MINKWEENQLKAGFKFITIKRKYKQVAYLKDGSTIFTNFANSRFKRMIKTLPVEHIKHNQIIEERVFFKED